MFHQVDRSTFAQALSELGLDPKEYDGKRLSLAAMVELYELCENNVLDAIHDKKISAHYDFKKDTIWVDALDAAHYYYCRQNEKMLFPHAS